MGSVGTPERFHCLGRSLRLAQGRLARVPVWRPDPLHPVIIRSASTLRGYPSDDLVGILDVTSLAVHAIRRIQTYALAIGGSTVVHHFVYIGWTEILARAAELLYAALLADVRIVNDKVGRLIFFVLRA